MTTLRPYRDEEDYWRIRAFLREVLLLNDMCELSWSVARFDYWRWHGLVTILEGEVPIETALFLYEVDGKLAAVLNNEGPGEAFLQVHPAHRSPALLEELVELAEARLAEPGEGGRKLCVWTIEGDELVEAILARRGYVRLPWVETQRWQRLDREIAPVPVAAGYTVRPLGGEEELPARSWVSWRAFHPDEPDEKYQGWEWYHTIQRIPLYRRDLDIVAVAPNGEHAAFCTIWYDDVTRTATVEPVGTHPDHWRRGLGRAVITENLRRAQRMGATLAYVGAYSERANALYQSLGFEPYSKSQAWEKTGL
jgi:GNAT superfamily N-acetyltransferase